MASLVFRYVLVLVYQVFFQYHTNAYRKDECTCTERYSYTYCSQSEYSVLLELPRYPNCAINGSLVEWTFSSSGWSMAHLTGHSTSRAHCRSYVHAVRVHNGSMCAKHVTRAIDNCPLRLGERPQSNSNTVNGSFRKHHVRRITYLGEKYVSRFKSFPETLFEYF